MDFFVGGSSARDGQARLNAMRDTLEQIKMSASGTSLMTIIKLQGKRGREFDAARCSASGIHDALLVLREFDDEFIDIYGSHPPYPLQPLAKVIETYVENTGKIEVDVFNQLEVLRDDIETRNNTLLGVINQQKEIERLLLELIDVAKKVIKPSVKRLKRIFVHPQQ
ncbi:uncharacterized protein LOC107044281 [Diachasma alloeum]|uniref:uncharacterized protein LOC107044281 n=1 Tax=Diachasma alloeum TaxID=454923 RepID=UPI0007383965|nr:uncharacterized protein LOC107044281 [Diachasma alloeum]